MRRLLILALFIVGSVAAARDYTVKPGDTLYSIARANGITLARLLMLNGLSSDVVKAGQVLKLPDAAPAAATSAAAPARAAAPASSGSDSVVRAAYRHLGKAYVWGASGPGAFDCSGYTAYVMRQFGVNLPHSSVQQFGVGRAVARNGLLPGDLVFFATRGAGISHVGIYIGNNRMIHASTPSTGVIVSSLGEPYYASRYVGARRVL
jgi:cell wall-associated NlpC family hydrolase